MTNFREARALAEACESARTAGFDFGSGHDPQMIPAVIVIPRCQPALLSDGAGRWHCTEDIR